MQSFAEFQIFGWVGSVTPVGDTLRVKVCANYAWTDKDQSVREEEYWNEVTIFKPGIKKFVSEAVGKGDRVMARGRMRDESFETKSGEKKWATARYADEFSLVTKSRAAPLSDD